MQHTLFGFASSSTLIFGATHEGDFNMLFFGKSYWKMRRERQRVAGENFNPRSMRSC